MTPTRRLDTVAPHVRRDFFHQPGDAPALPTSAYPPPARSTAAASWWPAPAATFPAGWRGHQRQLEREFGLPVTVANDANCMLLGEVWAGAAKGYTDVIGVTLGTGVGGGILIGGGVSAQQELLIDPLAEKVRASVMPAFAEGLELKSAALQNDAGLVGAVYYFKKHHD